MAQETQDDSSSRVLEEIIVTARKREESLQDAPVSVTAFTSEMITRAGITDINDVALRTPGLTYGNFGDEKLSPTSLRGVISGSGSAGADPAVGFYLDEVFLGQGVGATIDLFDLERIEVLRGPQGTLFGRNTIAGLIHYRTAAPTEQFEAYADAELGNLGYRRFGGAVSGPIAGSSVLGRLSFVSNQRDGTADNVVLDREVNSQDSWSARGQLQFVLGETAEWRVSGDYREVDQDSLVFETLSYNDATTFAQVLDLFGLPRNSDPFDRNVYADDVTYERSEAWGIASHFMTTIGGAELVNITAYRDHDYENRTDTDRSALRWGYDGDPEDVSRFSNELRVSSSAGALDWVAGLYYYEQETANLSFIELGPDLLTLLGVPLDSLLAGSDAKMDTTSVAGFGSLTWNFSDRLAATLGGRYTWEEKSIDYSQSDPVGLLGGDFAISAEDDWAEFTPSLNIEYDYSDTLMLYGTVSGGFKSGGFNDALGDANGISFDPETLWNYEAGLKSTLFEGRVQANVAVFYMDWEDIQISGDNPNTPVFDPIIINAGAAHSTGIEFELLSQPTDNLTIGLNFALLEAEYDEGSLPDGTPLAEIPRAPDYTANLNAEYRASLSQNIDWFIGGEVLARGESFLTVDNQEDGRVDAYALVNLQVGLEAPDGRWRLSVWGRNIGDETVKERLFDLSGQDVIGQKFIILNDPDTYGLSVRLRY
ncbi:TonB-dependent receptor [Lentisalinibacter sediminis]|uniref:TonB-dependent receptor n=1 Tax=Lentisalinibacter sediminis TaxID=2992237 RepID=UPI00386E2B63